MCEVPLRDVGDVEVRGVTQVGKKGHEGNIVTACVGGSMEHGLVHATHSSCWWCFCGSALLLVEVKVLLLLLCPSKAWS